MLAVACLERTAALQNVRALVLTHLTPKRMPSLKALLQLLGGRGGARLDVHLSNPALQLLRSSLGAARGPDVQSGGCCERARCSLCRCPALDGVCPLKTLTNVILQAADPPFHVTPGGDEEGAALLSSGNLVAARPGDKDSLEVGKVGNASAPPPSQPLFMNYMPTFGFHGGSTSWRCALTEPKRARAGRRAEAHPLPDAALAGPAGRLQPLRPPPVHLQALLRACQARRAPLSAQPYEKMHGRNTLGWRALSCFCAVMRFPGT